MKTSKLFQIIKNHWLEFFIGVIGILMLTDSLTKEEINQKTKFIELKSQLTTYNFVDGSRGYQHYYFYCDDYCNKFQIKADYISYFDKNNFPKFKGTELTFKITEKDFNNIPNCDKIFVYEISTEKQTLLKLNRIIEFENKKYDIILPCLFIFGATIGFTIRYNKYKKHIS